LFHDVDRRCSVFVAWRCHRLPPGACSRLGRGPGSRFGDLPTGISRMTLPDSRSLAATEPPTRGDSPRVSAAVDTPDLMGRQRRATRYDVSVRAAGALARRDRRPLRLLGLPRARAPGGTPPISPAARHGRAGSSKPSAPVRVGRAPALHTTRPGCAPSHGRCSANACGGADRRVTPGAGVTHRQLLTCRPGARSAGGTW